MIAKKIAWRCQWKRYTNFVAFNFVLRTFCFSFAFCLEGTRDVRRLRFALGSLGEVFTLGTRGISRVRREFLVLTEVRSREKKTFGFSFFSNFTETGNRARNLKVPGSLKLPSGTSLQTQTSLIHPIWRLCGVPITGRQARGALFLKLASFRRTKVHQEILLENLT